MQRYKFESDSQQPFVRSSHDFVVSTYAKIQIWKRFTTLLDCFTRKLWLCLPMQRYKFESDSQPYRWQLISTSVVSTYAKIQIWKRFTTYTEQCIIFGLLCLPMQRYKFESDSQHVKQIKLLWESCVYLCKDTNLKAIHNPFCHIQWIRLVVSTYAKIQIWKRFTTHGTRQRERG